MSSVSSPPSPEEIGNNTSNSVADDPETGIIESTEENTLSQHERIIRQESNASSSSASIFSSDDENVSYIATLIGSTANLCSATLGAGILALPFAFYQSGIVCGILLLLISSWATSSSIGLLAETYDAYNLSTYEKAVEKGLGRRFRKVVEISILVFCCGTAVGYVIAVGDIIERVVPFLTKSQHRLAMSSVWLVAMLPLSCLKRMKSLECASSVGILSIGTLLVAAVVHLVVGGGGGEHDKMYFYGFEGGDDGSGSGYDFDDDDAAFRLVSDRYNTEKPSFVSLLGPAGGSWLSVLQASPIFFYAFSSQVNVAQIFEELPGRRGNDLEKLRTMSNVTFLGVLVCGILYACLSLVTLIDFGNTVQPNVLSCYDLRSKGQPLLHVAFLGMALAVVIAFPLNIFPARVSLIQMWDEQRKPKDDDGREEESSPPPNVLPDIEGIRKPLLSKDRSRSTVYDSGGETDGNNTHQNDPLVSPAAAVQQQPAHLSISRHNSNDGDDDGDEFDDHERTEEVGCAKHAFVTLMLAGLALGLALVVPNISVVFGLLGGTTSSLLGFVVPGLLGLQRDRSRITAWVLVVFGSLFGVLSTGATVYAMVHG